MKDEDEFISELKKFKAASMPADLRERLSEPPQIPASKFIRLWLPALGTAAAACLALILFLRSEPSPGNDEEVALNILRVDSTLVSSEVVDFEEVDGVMHEVVMETWHDELSAHSSLDPLTADSTVVRYERVSNPVKFL